MKSFSCFLEEGKQTELPIAKIGTIPGMAGDIVLVYPEAMSSDIQKIKENFLLPYIKGRRLGGSIQNITITDSVSKKLNDIKGSVKRFKAEGTDSVTFVGVRLDDAVLGDTDEDGLANYNIELANAAKKSGADYVIFVTI